jgi:quinol monooxygenase YgiN
VNVPGKAGAVTRKTVTIITFFVVASRQTARFLEIVNGALDAMRREANFLEAALKREMVGEDGFLLTESWSIGEGDLTGEMSRRLGAAWHAELEGVLARPVAVSVWEVVRSERAGAS